jgi:acyl-CoA synthetase (AMP-forming)/AMP-acid ligase II
MYWTLERLNAAGLQPPPTRTPIPIGPRDVASLLDGPVRDTPEAPALIGRYERLTYAQLDERVNAGAAFLRSLGISEGDRVAATTPNHTDIVTAFLAVQRIGAMWLGINRNTAPGEKRYILQNASAKVYLADKAAEAQAQSLRGQLPELQHLIGMEPGEEGSGWRAGVATHLGAERPDVEIDPWAPACIAFTSGTTGFPKGVVHSQHNMVLPMAAISVRMGGLPGAEITRGVALPLTIQNMMIIGVAGGLGSGSRLVCIDRIDAEGVADWIEAEQVNTLALVPTVVQDMLTLPQIKPEKLKSLMSLGTGAAPVPEGLPSLYQQRFGQRIGVGYGLTECPTGVSARDENSPDVQGCIGRPIHHLEVIIQNEAGQPVPDEEAGEICFRAQQTGPWAHVYAGPLGYWRNAEATAKLLRGGWVHTADVGSFKDGELYIHDRRTDLIIRGGSNIYPAEVERVIRTDPRVRDVAVVGKPDERLGEVVVAFIETHASQRDSTLTADLAALCREEIAAYKTPVEWVLVEDLPRNAMGKVMKPQLRERIRRPSPSPT